jgi:replicative DNA helicase
MQERVLPQSWSMERAILGGLMQDWEAIREVQAVLSPEDFHRPSHRRLYEVMLAKAAAGGFDMLSILSYVGAAKDPEDYGGVGYVSLTPRECPSLEAFPAYIGSVRDASTRRRLILAAQRVIDMAQDMQPETANVVAAAEKEMIAAFRAGGASRDDWRSVADLAQAQADLYQQRTDAYVDAMREGRPTFAGVPTGLKQYDRLFRGVIRGSFDIIGGTSGMGKSAFGLYLAEKVASQGHGVGIFSMEMPHRSNLDRLVAGGAKVYGTRIGDGSFTRDEHERMLDELQRLAGLPLYLDETPGLTVQMLRQRVRRLRERLGKTGTPLLMVLIDFLQLVRVDIARGGNREQAMGEAAEAVRDLGKEEDVNITALVQLNQDCDKRADHRPVISDIRESGRIRQAADKATLLYRAHKYDPDADPSHVELILAKNRGGEEGTAEAVWDGPTTWFRDVDPDRVIRATGRERTEPQDYHDGWRSKK